MKKFLISKIFLVLYLFCFLCLLNSDAVIGQSKESYYKDYFLDLGVQDSVDVKLTSGLSGGLDVSLMQERVILICDEDFVYQDVFSCNYYDYEILRSYSRDISAVRDDTDLPKVLEVNFYNNTLYVIPEMSLTSAEARILVENHFRAYIKASHLEAHIQSDTDSSTSKSDKVAVSIRDRVREIRNLNLYESFVYASWVLLFVLVFGPVFLYIKNKPNAFRYIFNPEIYKHGLTNTINYWERLVLNFRPYLLFIFATLLFQFVGFLAILSYLDKGRLHVAFIVDHLFRVAKFRDLGSDDHLTLFWLSGLLIILLLMFTPKIATIFGKSLECVISRSANLKNLKHLLALLIFSGLLTVLFFPIEPSFIILVFIVMVVFYFVVLFQKQGKPFREVYTKRYRMVFGTFLLIILFLGVIDTVVREGGLNQPRYVTEDLITVPNGTVMLPYERAHKGRTLFRDYFVKSTTPIFVDKYLIYYPGYTKVENRNINTFSNVGSYLIINPERSVMLRELLLGNEGLSNLLREEHLESLEEPGSTFSVLDSIWVSNSDKPTDYYFRMTFDCTSQPKPGKVKIRTYYLSPYAEVSRLDRDIIYFPGCSDSKTNGALITPTVSYVVPITFSLDKTFIYELIDFEITGLSSFEVIEGENLKLLLPISYSQKDKLLFIKEAQDDGTIVSYTFDEIKPLKFDTVVEDKIFNLSYYANILQRERVLNQPFIIWSSAEGNIIIRRN
jgi:hypothetical protein